MTPQKRVFICNNCGELGHNKKKCPVIHISDEERVLIDDKIRAHKKEAHRINRAKYRNSPKGKKKEREYEQSDERKEASLLLHSSEEFKTKDKEYRKSEEYKAKLKEYRESEEYKAKRKEYRESEEYKAKRKEYRESEEYKAKQKERNEKRKTTKQLLRLHAENIVIDPQYPDALVPEDELARIDAEYDFDKLKRMDNDVFLDACPRMSYDYTTNNCCVVCDCDWPKAFTTFYSLDDAFLPKLRARVALTEDRKRRMQPPVQEDYCLAKYDKRLDGLILSRYGLYTSTYTPIDLERVEPVEDLRLCLCHECADVIIKGGVSKSSFVSATSKPADVSAFPSAGSKRSRKQKERKE